MKAMIAVATLCLFLSVACSRKGAGGPARVPVTIARAEQRAIPFEIAATGTAEPRQTVSGQSQVLGVLTQVAFREGDDVLAGQGRFQIAPRTLQAAPAKPTAMLTRDQEQDRDA